jgi:hypothetical protein
VILLDRYKSYLASYLLEHLHDRYLLRAPEVPPSACGRSGRWLRDPTMTAARAFAICIPRKIWIWIRQVSGDAAYENYLRSTRRIAGMAPAETCAVHAGCSASAEFVQPFTREESYLHALQRRYSTVSRCC